MKLRISLLVLLLLAMFVVPLWAGDARQDLVKAGVPEQIIAKNKLRIGFSTFVPWAMKDKTGGYTGYEIEVAKQLAADMGVEAVFIPTKWSGIIPALLTGKFDIIIGGMGITPARQLKVDFSDPYEFSGMSIVANSKLAGKRVTLDAFNDPKVTIVARIGTTAATAAKEYLPKAKLRLFDDEGQALQEVLNNRAMAMVASQPFPEFRVVDYASKLYLPLAGQTFTKEPIGFAVRKGDAGFLKFLNKWIAEKNSAGWLQERHAYWFTTKDWESQVQ